MSTSMTASEKQKSRKFWSEKIRDAKAYLAQAEKNLKALGSS